MNSRTLISAWPLVSHSRTLSSQEYVFLISLEERTDRQDFIYQPALTERWLALPPDATAPIKQSLLSTLGTQNRQVGNAVAQCVSAVAMVELPAEKWAELMPALLQFAQDQDNVQLRVSTLVTLGFICEVIVSTTSRVFSRTWLIVEPGDSRDSIKRDLDRCRVRSTKGGDEYCRPGSCHYRFVQLAGIHQGQL
jgi:hypothetical protein